MQEAVKSRIRDVCIESVNKIALYLAQILEGI